MRRKKQTENQKQRQQMTQKKKKADNEKIAMKVSKVSIVVNLVLSILKLAAGLLASSGAMLSDAIHSASDVFSTFIVMIGIKMSGKDSDKEHPYGHERMECVAAIVLSVILAVIGIGIGYAGMTKILAGNYAQLQVPGMAAQLAAVISVAVKEWMYHYTRVAAKKINSGALLADAWHHRSDALSSVGAFIGILGARMGYPVTDAIASVVICVFILKAAYDIFKDAIDKMVDKSCDVELEEQIKNIAFSVDGVVHIDKLTTRMFGNRIYVDIEIACDGKKTLNETHATAESVHDKIENSFTEVKHIMVHVNPVRTK